MTLEHYNLRVASTSENPEESLVSQCQERGPEDSTDSSIEEMYAPSGQKINVLSEKNGWNYSVWRSYYFTDYLQRAIFRRGKRNTRNMEFGAP